ncbi:MAG: hypothetical protein EXS36_04575 [Pedosphaera sp.]|nr:hypothetical protein [Pedosphaera sp.]
MPGSNDFDDFFARFIAGVVRTPSLKPYTAAPSSINWTAFDPATEKLWCDQTLSCIERAGPEYHQHRDASQKLLADSIKRIAGKITSASLDLFFADCAEITSHGMLNLLPGRDFYYIKINHGYWEQLYALFGSPDQAKMRITDPTGYRKAYVTSGFVDAMEHVIRGAATDDGQGIRFESIHFGVSLLNGTADHSKVMARFPDRTAEAQRIVLGAAIGLIAYFNSLFGERRLSFSDGSFPKRGLETGALRKVLRSFEGASDRIVFVVPPHLKGIRLADAHIPQEQIYVSGSLVHESWAASLYFTVRHILERLEVDDRVIVITQSGVFSARLGLFLKSVKDALVPHGKRIYFFDLGQVTDIANPQHGGRWIQSHKVSDKTLFHLSGNPPAFPFDK